MNQYKTKKFADTWHSHLKNTQDPPRTYLINEIIEKVIGDLKGKVVLEAGCGNGFFIPNLLKKHPKKVIGIDISGRLLGFAKKEIQAKNVEFYQMDLTKKLKFKNNYFNLIVSYTVLQEIKDISTPLKEMTRVLKKKGEMLIAVPHPLYQLFVTGIETKNNSSLENLKRYGKITTTTSPSTGCKVFIRPVSFYITKIIENDLKILEIREINATKKLGKISKLYKPRVGIPICLLFRLRK